MDMKTLVAEKRDRAGKGAARAIRREGRVPGVIYGDKKEPLMLSLDPRDLLAAMDTRGFWTHQFEIELDGKKHRTMCQDVQKHPVTDQPIHVDFLRISKDSVLTIDVPVTFINEEKSPGLKRGGVMNIVRRSVEVKCSAANIPEEFIVDLAGCDINDSIHISAVELPKGVTPTITDRDFTIATVAAPSAVASAASEEEGAEEEGAEEEAKAEE